MYLNDPLTRPGTVTLPAVAGWHRLLLAQGFYYLLTALWAIVDIHSFQAVTGPKTDVWLVRTVAVMILAASLSMLVAARKPAPSPETTTLAVGCAAGLLAIDVIYVTAAVIPPVYLIDAAAEVGLLLWWVWDVVGEGGRRSPTAEK